MVLVLSTSLVVLCTHMAHGLLVMYSLIVDIEFGHATCFGQWNALDVMSAENMVWVLVWLGLSFYVSTNAVARAYPE